MAEKTTKIEHWRVRRGLSYADLGRLLGCTRQYARQLCIEGLDSAELILRILIVTDGVIQPGDLLTPGSRELLRKDRVLRGGIKVKAKQEIETKEEDELAI